MPFQVNVGWPRVPHDLLSLPFLDNSSLVSVSKRNKSIAKSAKRNLRDCHRNAMVQSLRPCPGGWLTRIDSPMETAALKRSLREADTYAQVYRELSPKHCRTGRVDDVPPQTLLSIANLAEDIYPCQWTPHLERGPWKIRRAETGYFHLHRNAPPPLMLPFSSKASSRSPHHKSSPSRHSHRTRHMFLFLQSRLDHHGCSQTVPREWRNFH